MKRIKYSKPVKYLKNIILLVFFTFLKSLLNYFNWNNYKFITIFLFDVSCTIFVNEIRYNVCIRKYNRIFLAHQIIGKKYLMIKNLGLIFSIFDSMHKVRISY